MASANLTTDMDVWSSGMGIESQKMLYEKMIYPRYRPHCCYNATAVWNPYTFTLDFHPCWYIRRIEIWNSDTFSKKICGTTQIGTRSFLFPFNVNQFFSERKGLDCCCCLLFCRPRVQSSLFTRIASHGKRSFFVTLLDPENWEKWIHWLLIHLEMRWTVHMFRIECAEIISDLVLQNCQG